MTDTEDTEVEVDTLTGMTIEDMNLIDLGIIPMRDREINIEIETSIEVGGISKYILFLFYLK